MKWWMWTILAAFVILAIFGRTTGKVGHYNYTPAIENYSEPAENFTHLYNPNMTDCEFACEKKHELGNIIGTYQWENCAIQNEKVWCWDKKGKEKCKKFC